MSSEDVLSAINDKVMGIRGVVAFQYLDQRLRQRIEELEREAESNGAVGGLMAFVNRGVWATLTRQICFVIIVENDVPLLAPQAHLLHIIDEKGSLIGEYIPEGRREDMIDREDVYFLSDDFVLYGDVRPVGEPHFVIPEMDFPVLSGMPGIINLTSASVSTLSDDFIRKHMGFENTTNWTHLVGFDLKD